MAASSRSLCCKPGGRTELLIINDNSHGGSRGAVGESSRHKRDVCFKVCLGIEMKLIVLVNERTGRRQEAAAENILTGKQKHFRKKRKRNGYSIELGIERGFLFKSILFRDMQLRQRPVVVRTFVLYGAP